MRKISVLTRAFMFMLGLSGALVVGVPSARAIDCTIRFRLDTNVTLAGMTLQVDYSEAGGEWPVVDFIYGSACEPLGDYMTIGTADDFSKTLGLIHQTSGPTLLDGPTDFTDCAYRRVGSAPSASDFAITVTGGYLPGGIPANPVPTVSISDIDCGGGEPTTTSSTFPPTTVSTTTSSTFPPTTVSTTTTTLAPVGACGDPVDPPTFIGEFPAVVNATDALFTLRTAVSLESCSLCVCDLDDSGSVTASDALALLLLAVGQPGSLDCPPCA
jgi:hypothetical protein